MPQNKFHKSSLKTEKNHNKFSSQIIMTSPKLTYKIIVQNGHEQVFCIILAFLYSCILIHQMLQLWACKVLKKSYAIKKLHFRFFIKEKIFGVHIFYLPPSDALNFVLNTILCYYVLCLLGNLMHQTIHFIGSIMKSIKLFSDLWRMNGLYL